MASDTSKSGPTSEQLLDACRTISGLPAHHDKLAMRLQFIADLLADTKALPSEPILLWREADRHVRHTAIGRELVVGRQVEEGGLEMRNDNLLSRRHFIIRAAAEGHILEDCPSHNGIAINEPENRVQHHRLQDGDIILAGNQIFVFLSARRTGEQLR